MVQEEHSTYIFRGFWTPERLKAEVLRSFETSENVNKLARRYSTEGLNPEQNHCGNLFSRTCTSFARRTLLDDVN
jgi:hypothetical protein